MTFDNRNHIVVARVQNESRRADCPEQRRDIDVCARFEQPRSRLGRGRLAAELVEPADLLVARAGNEARSKHLAEYGIVAAPAEADEFDHRAVETFLVRVFAVISPARVAAVKYEMRNALRVFG